MPNRPRLPEPRYLQSLPKTHPNARYPYSNMKRRMLTFMSRPTHMATVMVDEPP